jgi:hypothetical protein
MLVNGNLQVANGPVAAAIQVNDWIFHGNELEPIAIGYGDANRNSGIFDNLLLHNNIPRPCTHGAKLDVDVLSSVLAQCHIRQVHLRWDLPITKRGVICQDRAVS